MKYRIFKNFIERYNMNIIVLILGLIIGSFLNVCIYRIPKGESIIYPPSYCEKCGVHIKYII